MKWRLFLLAGVLVSVAFGAKLILDKDQKPPKETLAPPEQRLPEKSTVLPEAKFLTEEGWQDLAIPIQETTFGSDGSCTVKAIGLLDGTTLGLELVVIPGMKPGVVADEIDREAFYANGITVRSLGEPTEHLLRVLANAYGLEIPKGTIRPSIPLTSFALSGDPG